MADQHEVDRLNLLIQKENNALHSSRDLLDELRIERRVLLARLIAIEQESPRETRQWLGWEKRNVPERQTRAFIEKQIGVKLNDKRYRKWHPQLVRPRRQVPPRRARHIEPRQPQPIKPNKKKKK